MRQNEEIGIRHFAEYLHYLSGIIQYVTTLDTVACVQRTPMKTQYERWNKENL